MVVVGFFFSSSIYQCFTRFIHLFGYNLRTRRKTRAPKKLGKKQESIRLFSLFFFYSSQTPNQTQTNTCDHGNNRSRLIYIMCVWVTLNLNIGCCYNVHTVNVWIFIYLVPCLSLRNYLQNLYKSLSMGITVWMKKKRKLNAQNCNDQIYLMPPFDG